MRDGEWLTASDDDVQETVALALGGGGAATTVVLGGREGDGETGRGMGSALVGSVGDGVANDKLREAAELRCSGEDTGRRGGGSGET